MSVDLSVISLTTVKKTYSPGPRSEGNDRHVTDRQSSVQGPQVVPLCESCLFAPRLKISSPPKNSKLPVRSQSLPLNRRDVFLSEARRPTSAIPSPPEEPHPSLPISTSDAYKATALSPSQTPGRKSRQTGTLSCVYPWRRGRPTERKPPRPRLPHSSVRSGTSPATEH